MKETEYPGLSNYYLWIRVITALIMTGFLFYFQWIVGLVFLIIIVLLFIYMKREGDRINKSQMEYISQLSYQVESAGSEVFRDMPLGILLYDDVYHIKWANPYMEELDSEQTLIGEPLDRFTGDLTDQIKSNKKTTWITINNLAFKTKIDQENQTLYLFNRTEEKNLQQQFQDERVVLAHISLDNYEEISGNMSDSVKSQLNSEITSILNNWAETYQFYIKRTSQDRFLAIFTQQTLAVLEKSHFEILDGVRKIDMEEVQQSPVTLSIGVGTGEASIPHLASLAQSSLDLALGRGGDQVAIRDETGKTRFYGGKTNPMEKRTRVRARVISHALKQLVKESDNVIIMGHKSPDMDALGAAIGVLNIAKSNNVEGFIVLDDSDVLTGISKVMEKVKKEESLYKHFIGQAEAEAIYTSRSLVVVVDTHRPGMAAHEKLLRHASNKVVIDHHRRGEDFIENPTLVYMEPYASSTSELVTELIEYQPDKKKLSALEATALLSGIIVDTKSFALRTGSRTFDAASYLRSKGADPILVQDFLKEDLDTVVSRNKLIEQAYMYQNVLSIAVADTEEDYDQITIAQAADTLLTIDNVKASFVIAKQGENRVSVSARSLGEINVQLIMEAMEGGGHLTNAATQLEKLTLADTEEMLKEKINEYFEGRT
ncbi:MAG TPA: DHH family phosphoesterase [Pseudogracilibacillus sp.]|nr:DHH family phosphoesterase [Pseudogracilibacillus sp.]